MDFNFYSKLPPADKAEVWQQLEETHGWQIIQDFYRRETQKPEVKDTDSKEAFYFQAAKEAGALDVLNFPNRQNRLIR